MRTIAFVIFLCALFTAAYFDIKERRIPNSVTYPLVLSSFLWLNRTVIISIIITFVAILIMGDLIGAGDLKLGLATYLWSSHFAWATSWFFYALLFAFLAAMVLRVYKGEEKIAFAPYLTLGFVIANILAL